MGTLTKHHVEEGERLENAVASMIDLVRIWKVVLLLMALFGSGKGLTAFNIVVYDDAVFFCPTYYLGIVDGRVGGDCTDSCRRDAA